jgi:hypothetical protein
MVEAELYTAVTAELRRRSFEVLTHDIGAQTPDEVAGVLATAILVRLEHQPDEG